MRATRWSAVAGTLLVVGCAPAMPGDPPEGVRSTPPARSAPATPSTPQPDPTTAAEVRAGASPGTEFAGLSAAFLTSTEPRVEDRNTTTFLTVLADPLDGPAILFAAAPGDRFEVLADGSVLVRDPDGVAVAGMHPPTGGSARAVASDLLAIDPDPAEPGGPAVLSAWIADRAVAAAEWGDREGGRSLAVAPNEWARAGSAAALALTWAELVAGSPEVETNTMHDQLACHMLGAPEKETWNLEPWRPDVGLVEVLAARCNP